DRLVRSVSALPPIGALAVSPEENFDQREEAIVAELPQRDRVLPLPDPAEGLHLLHELLPQLRVLADHAVGVHALAAVQTVDAVPEEALPLFRRAWVLRSSHVPASLPR